MAACEEGEQTVNGQYAMLGILWLALSGIRRDVDDMPGFPFLHVRQRRRNAVQHALDV